MAGVVERRHYVAGRLKETRFSLLALAQHVHISITHNMHWPVNSLGLWCLGILV